jgi:serpin B
MKVQIRWLIALLGCLLLGLFADSGAKSTQQAMGQHLSRLVSPSVEPRPLSQIPPSDPMPSSSPVDSRLTAAQTRFSFKLFSQLQQDPTQNLSISPSSVAIALSMLYNGATGDTQQAMAAALELQGMSLDDLNQANADLEKALENADPKVTLTIANSLWGRDGFDFKPDFLQRNQTYYGAKITNLDFNSPDAPAQINGWVNQNTAGKIPQIIDQIDPAEVLFLINAIYFKGDWTAPFNPEQTRERPFQLSDGSTKQQPMMEQQGNYVYLETDQFQAVSLPYGNRRWSMYIFLPRPESSLSAFQQSLTAENWQTWISQFSRRQGSIQLPKFKIEYETSLNEALQALGMEVAFTAGQAEFANLADQELVISEVKHKTFIEVNETGTEAAAATSIGIALTSLDPNPPFQMQVDRPFFYAIRDHQTGSLLFMGSVVNPE